MSTITSTYMSLPIPVVGSESGPQYAQDINNCLTIIDQHNHTGAGEGQQLTPASLNINSNLTFNNNSLLFVKSTQYQAQTAALTSATNPYALYTVGVDLYYNDGTSQIPITTGGSVNAGAGSIGGLPSGTAGVSYGASTYTFNSATNTRATLDAGSLVLRNTTALSKALTLSPPNSMGADYNLTLPALPTGTSKIMVLDTSGNMSALYTVDNSTIDINGSNQFEVKALGITAAQIANNTITGSQMATSLTLNTVTISNSLTSPSISGTGAGSQISNFYNIYATNQIQASNVSATTSLSAPAIFNGSGQKAIFCKSPSAPQKFFIQGGVNSSGGGTNGDGFSSSKLSSGTYQVAFTSGFSGADGGPSAVVTPKTTAIVFSTLYSVDTSQFTVKFYDTSGTLTDSGFQFTVIGA